MPSYQKKHEICAYSMQRDKIKGEREVAGVGPENASTQRCADTASDTFKGTLEQRYPHGADEPARKRMSCVGKEGAVMNDSDDGRENTRTAFEAAAKPSVEIDVEKYQALLDDPDISETQKDEIMRTLWKVMMAFVDLGFGVHPAQEVCGKPEQTLDVSVYTDSNEP